LSESIDLNTRWMRRGVPLLPATAIAVREDPLVHSTNAGSGARLNGPRQIIESIRFGHDAFIKEGEAYHHRFKQTPERSREMSSQSTSKKRIAKDRSAEGREAEEKDGGGAVEDRRDGEEVREGFLPFFSLFLFFSF